MFDIGFPELMLVAIVGLLVIGPKRLPEALRTLGLWLGRMRRSFTTVKTEIEKEIGMDEVRRQLHNEAVMEEMKRIEREVKQTGQAASIGAPDPIGLKPTGATPDNTRPDAAASAPADDALGKASAPSPAEPAAEAVRPKGEDG